LEIKEWEDFRNMEIQRQQRIKAYGDQPPKPDQECRVEFYVTV
jgi:hypothetical protein